MYFITYVIANAVFYCFNSVDLILRQAYTMERWHRGVVVECRTRNQEVVGSSLGQALRRKNSWQVSHTYG